MRKIARELRVGVSVVQRVKAQLGERKLNASVPPLTLVVPINGIDKANWAPCRPRGSARDIESAARTSLQPADQAGGKILSDEEIIRISWADDAQQQRTEILS
jgi:hypothetical protein